MLTCNLCGKHHATIAFKGIVNDHLIKLRLCDACAKKNGMVFPYAASVESLSGLLAELAAVAHPPVPLAQTACRTCGLTYAEFKGASQFGCAQCYEAFGALVGPLLKRIHGSSLHVGKSGPATVRRGSRVERLAELKLELREALRSEDFERAALLRDQIKHLDQEAPSPRRRSPS